MNLFKILGTIAVSNSDANASIDETADKAEGFSSKLKTGIGTAAKWGAAIGAGAVAAGAAVYGFAGKAASATDTVDKMSQKIGISRSAYQELDFICSQSGTSVSTLQMGMKSLTAAMDGAKSGTESNVEQFEKLGVSVTNADGSLRSQEEMLWETMAALQKMDNQTEKSRLATELFGRSGSELMPLLNGASGSIDKMRQQANDLGLVLGDKTIDAGVKFTDTVDQVQRSLSAVATKVGVSVMPVIQQLLSWVIENMPTIQAVLSNVFGVLAIVVQTVISILTMLYDRVSAYFPVIQQFVQDAFTKIQAYWESSLKPCFEAIANFIMNVLYPAFQQVFEHLIKPLVENVFKAVNELWDNTLKPVFTGIITFLTGVFTGNWLQAWEGIKSILSGIWEGIKTVVKLAIDNIKTVVSATWTMIKTVTGSIWNSIKSIVSNVANAIRAVISSVFNAVKAAVSNILNSIKNTFSSIWNGIKSIVTDAVNGVKSTISNGMDAAKSTVSAILDGIKNKFRTVMDGAKDIVKGAVDKIKSFFNFSWSLPDIKLPHFNISGKFSLKPPGVPKFSVDWYAKAMEDGIIMNQPTIFGYNAGTNRFMGGGEAGSETVVGTENLMDMIQGAVDRRSSGLAPLLSEILEVLKGLDADIYAVFVKALENMRFTVDGREFARLVRKV